MHYRKKGFMRTWSVLLSTCLTVSAVGMIPAKEAKAESNTTVIQYFGDWHGIPLSSLPWDKLDYLNHAFWHAVPADNTVDNSQDGAHINFKIEPTNSSDLTSTGYFAQYAEMHAAHPDVKIMLSIGGWTDCGYFSEMAWTSKGRESFVKSCVDTIKAYPFIAGIDIDWEYPGVESRTPDDGNDEGCPIFTVPFGATPSSAALQKDKEDFTALLKLLREELDAEFGKGVKKVTACSATGEYALKYQDWENASKYLDYVNVMTYASASSSHVSADASLNMCIEAVEYLKDENVPSSKINLGCIFASKVFRVSSIPSNPANLISMSAADAGEYTTDEIVGFENSVVTGSQKGWHYYYDTNEGASYLYNDDSSSQYYKQVITYDSEEALWARIDYIASQNLGGMIVWELPHDDTTNWTRTKFLADKLLNGSSAQPSPSASPSASPSGAPDPTPTPNGETVFDTSRSVFTVGDTTGTANILTITDNGSKPTDHGYKIDSVDGFKHFVNLVNHGTDFSGLTVTLGADIDLNPGITLLDSNLELNSGVASNSNLYKFSGIGAKVSDVMNGFNGTFNGNGYVIKGVYMDTASCANKTGPIGVFNVIENATLKNVVVCDSYIKSTGNGYGIGGLVGATADENGAVYGVTGAVEDNNIIQNCAFIGQVDASATTKAYVGGLVGFNGTKSGTKNIIDNCYAYANVKSGAEKRVSILVGQNYGTVSGSIVLGGKLTAQSATSETGALQGRTGTYGEEMNYAVKNLCTVNSTYDLVETDSTGETGIKYVDGDTAMGLCVNKTVKALINGTYQMGKGIPTVSGDTTTWSHSYYQTRYGAFVNIDFENDFTKLSQNGAPEDDGYFGSDSYPSFSQFAQVADPTNDKNRVLRMEANSARCQLLLQYAAADLPLDAQLSVKFYVPEGSSVASGLDENNYYNQPGYEGVCYEGFALQEPQQVAPQANRDQVMFVKLGSEEGDVKAIETFEQGQWYTLTADISNFTDGNIILNFWKSIYVNDPSKMALVSEITNHYLYIDDFAVYGDVDIANSEGTPDSTFEPDLPEGAEDNGYNYSFTVSEDGIKGLPTAITDGSATNVTPELLDALATANSTPGFWKPAKNFIVLIGDGMGIDPVTSSEHWTGELIMNELPNQAGIMTRSYSTTRLTSQWVSGWSNNLSVTKDLRTTDSAAGGTAIGTGYKTYYYSLCYGINGEKLPTLFDVARSKGLACGDMTNGWLSDATPCTLGSAYQWYRGMESEEEDLAATGQISLQTQLYENCFNVLIGYANDGETITTQYNKRPSFNQENDIFLTDVWADYVVADHKSAIYRTNCDFGFDVENDIEEAGYTGDAATVVYKKTANMAQTTAKTLQKLQKDADGKGFYVMFEDGEIDMDGHDNKFLHQIQEVQNFDESIAIAVKFALENPDTVIIVTADHDSGGMILKDGWDKYYKKNSYSTSGHSGNNVPVYALGYGTEIFNGQVMQNSYTGRIMGVLMGDSTFGDSENSPMVILDGNGYGPNKIQAIVDTDVTIGNYSSDPLATYNVLSYDEKIAANSKGTVLAYPPTLSDSNLQSASIVKRGTKLTRPADLPSYNNDCSFTGWYKDRECTTLWDFENDTVNAEGDTVLYAGWGEYTGPTLAPTSTPTTAPSVAPTQAPTETPTATATAKPTATPTAAATAKPSATPTQAPSATPTQAPGDVPTTAPTSAPTEAPTSVPGEVPTTKPTSAPTEVPTTEPTSAPTEVPTTEPTEAPTIAPTVEPTEEPTATPTQTPELTGVEKFVIRCYKVAFEREPDEGGFNYWKGEIENGKLDGTLAVYKFVFSPEYKAQNTSNKQFITDLYTMFMGREPDEGGFAYWMDKIENGMSRANVFSGFANSKEFYNLCKDYGITAGYFNNAYDLNKLNLVNLFVERLYKVCLSRLGDQGGQNYWAEGLITGKLTGLSCATNFIKSSEYEALNLSDEEYVKNLYLAFMGREYDRGGLDYWLGILKSGKTRDYVFRGFAYSPEFKDICNSYGITLR